MDALDFSRLHRYFSNMLVALRLLLTSIPARRTISHAYTFALVAEHQGQTVVELAKLDSTKGYVMWSRLIELERDGLVRPNVAMRKHHDARTREYWLTPKGQRLYRALQRSLT